MPKEDVPRPRPAVAGHPSTSGHDSTEYDSLPGLYDPGPLPRDPINRAEKSLARQRRRRRRSVRLRRVTSRRVVTSPFFRRSVGFFLSAFGSPFPSKIARVNVFDFDFPPRLARAMAAWKLKTNKNAREREIKRWMEGQKEEEAAPIKRRYIISVHMHKVDRSIHPSVSQSKAIDERTQLGGSGERINRTGGRGGNELTEPKTQRQVVLNVIGKVSLRE